VVPRRDLNLHAARSEPHGLCIDIVDLEAERDRLSERGC
jgi:hypothetical protein